MTISRLVILGASRRRRLRLAAVRQRRHVQGEWVWLRLHVPRSLHRRQLRNWPGPLRLQPLPPRRSVRCCGARRLWVPVSAATEWATVRVWPILQPQPLSQRGRVRGGRRRAHLQVRRLWRRALQPRRRRVHPQTVPQRRNLSQRNWFL